MSTTGSPWMHPADVEGQDDQVGQLMYDGGNSKAAKVGKKYQERKKKRGASSQNRDDDKDDQGGKRKKGCQCSLM